MRRFVVSLIAVGASVVGFGGALSARHAEQVSIPAPPSPRRLETVPTVSTPPVIADARSRLLAPLILPPDGRGWEVIPGVVRTDGSESFSVEVDVNGPVVGVRLELNNLALEALGPAPGVLRDDGLEGDRRAGDSVYTSVPFRVNGWIGTPTYAGDPDSPSGLNVTTIGTILIDEVDGTVGEFLRGPTVGVVRPDIPAVATVALAPDVVVSAHLVNVRSSRATTQEMLRNFAPDVTGLTRRVYDVLPDVFDYLAFFSTNKLEHRTTLAAPNFNAGMFWLTRVDFTGTGLVPFDSSANFGSRGRLHGLAALDFHERGVVSNNFAHELLHQWAVFLPLLSDGTAHYSNWSSVGSLLGGFHWRDNGDGTFTLDCEEGRNGAHRASSLDRYLMGLIDGRDVPPIRTMHPSVNLGAKCSGEPVLPTDVASVVTIGTLQAFYGIRQPGPGGAPRDFRVGFVAESRDRLLTSTEMTFYETLAAHAMRELPVQQADPYVGFNWVPLTRFFGSDVSVRTDVWPPLPVAISAIEASPSVLWPPNHTMRRVVLTVTASDGSATAPQCRITNVTSTEPGRDDWRLAGPLEVWLKAERRGNGNGRVYTLAVTCRNAAGASATGEAQVLVRHDSRRTTAAR